jgi:hypothetical protein
MREIKFKAKTINDNKWVYGFYTENFNNSLIDEAVHFDSIGNSESVYHVDPETVCQYIKTFKGVDVYENDYYLINGVKHVINFSNDELCYFAGHLILSATIEHREIVGNIHDLK